MIITKEHQLAMIQRYIKAHHTRDECIGFIDGIEAVMQLIDKIDKENKESAKKIKKL